MLIYLRSIQVLLSFLLGGPVIDERGRKITLDATLLRLKAGEEGMDGSAELLSHIASARGAGASSDLVCKRLEYLSFP